MIPIKFQFIWLSGFRGEDFLEINKSETRLSVAAIFLTDRDEISNLYRGLSKDDSYPVSVHLTKRFQRRRILKISQSETRVACGGYVC